MSKEILKKLNSHEEYVSEIQELNLCGVGLGISICKSITMGMGGHLNFKSEVGKGSLFTFNIEVQNWKVAKSENSSSPKK
jgi:K+-sensing histidine kinase KdpD